MQSGFDVAMGGSFELTEEENKLLQSAEYDKTVEKYTTAIHSLLQQQREEILEQLETEYRKRFKEYGKEPMTAKLAMFEALSIINKFRDEK